MEVYPRPQAIPSDSTYFKFPGAEVYVLMQRFLNAQASARGLLTHGNIVCGDEKNGLFFQNKTLIFPWKELIENQYFSKSTNQALFLEIWETD